MTPALGLHVAPTCGSIITSLLFPGSTGTAVDTHVELSVGTSAGSFTEAGRTYGNPLGRREPMVPGESRERAPPDATDRTWYQRYGLGVGVGVVTAGAAVVGAAAGWVNDAKVRLLLGLLLFLTTLLGFWLQTKLNDRYEGHREREHARHIQELEAARTAMYEYRGDTANALGDLSRRLGLLIQSPKDKGELRGFLERVVQTLYEALYGAQGELRGKLRVALFLWCGPGGDPRPILFGSDPGQGSFKEFGRAGCSLNASLDLSENLKDAWSVMLDESRKDGVEVHDAARDSRQYGKRDTLILKPPEPDVVSYYRKRIVDSNSAHGLLLLDYWKLTELDSNDRIVIDAFSHLLAAGLLAVPQHTPGAPEVDRPPPSDNVRDIRRQPRHG
jgi:hypothetical protein